MSFWNTEYLKARLPELIVPFDEARIANCSYELSMGSQAFVTRDESLKRQRLDMGDQVIVEPGQFALLLTEEQISIPPDAIALISVRTRFKMRGIINVSGFHVDPGFEGHLQFSVYNAGSKPVSVSRGDPVFLMWFASLRSPTGDLYRGGRGQPAIPDQDIMALAGEAYSPMAVARRVEHLQDQVRVNRSLMMALITGFVLLLLGVVLQAVLGT
jgi:dCTP deaminase